MSNGRTGSYATPSASNGAREKLFFGAGAMNTWEFRKTTLSVLPSTKR